MKRSSRFSQMVRREQGFTLVELIVVIAVLGILSLILIPQFSLYGDKAMATAARSDARSILSIAISHNMDNVNYITQDDMNKYMGMKPGPTYSTSGKTVGKDDSGSKEVEVGPAGDVIKYRYRRGGLTLVAKINVASQLIQWDLYGLGSLAPDNPSDPNYNRFEALKSGLKILNNVQGGPRLDNQQGDPS